MTICDYSSEWHTLKSTTIEPLTNVELHIYDEENKVLFMI